MGLFDFFRKTKTKTKQLPTPPKDTVHFDHDAVSCIRKNGLTESVLWSKLRAVLINTTADGPMSDDFFWVLVGQDSGCIVPSEAQGSSLLLERLQQLPGFDNKAVILASQCVEEKSFLCWEKVACAE